MITKIKTLDVKFDHYSQIAPFKDDHFLVMQKFEKDGKYWIGLSELNLNGVIKQFQVNTEGPDKIQSICTCPEGIILATNFHIHLASFDNNYKELKWLKTNYVQRIYPMFSSSHLYSYLKRFVPLNYKDEEFTIMNTTDPDHILISAKVVHSEPVRRAAVSFNSKRLAVLNKESITFYSL